MKNLSEFNFPGTTMRYFRMQTIFRFACLLAGYIAFLTALINPLSARQSNNQASNVTDIGTRRELFVDEFLVERLSGKAELRLHHPELRDVAIVHDEPWEGNTCGYHSVFTDGNLFRMYYRGSQITLTADKSAGLEAHP